MKILRAIVLILGILGAAAAIGQTQVPNVFQSGQPARAAEVNENFDVVEAEIDQNAAGISANVEDIAGNHAEITQNTTSITTNASDIAANLDAIQTNSAAIQGLDVAAIEFELQRATDYGRRGMHNGNSALTVLERLVGTLGLTCADANYGLFLGCTQLTAGDGTVWPFVQIITEFFLALILVDDFQRPAGMPTPIVFIAQTNGNPSDMVVAGSANLLRWTFRDQDDTARLVDDCNNPTVAMGPASNSDNATSARWRLNNGGYYYVPFDPNTGTQVVTGQLDVTGQTVGIVKNINPFSVFDVNTIVWCEMSNQVTGVYNTFDILPYPFNLNEARFSMPMIPN